ncbi:MAG: ribosome silencing factor [Treponema sp.]|jgi:ribosome-associated protein|nr:ribosome silencing factor [Treponema sp.]
MADMLPETEPLPFALAELLREHKGQDVSVLDLRGIIDWTDFFVITTVTSKAHMDGLERHIKDYCYENEIEIFGSSRKNADNEWRLLDLGSIIIHLMTSGVREFYELERLWKVPSAVSR